MSDNIKALLGFLWVVVLIITVIYLNNKKRKDGNKNNSNKTFNPQKDNKYISKDGKIRFTNNFTSVWIDPDKLDFEGEIIATSPNKNYYFAEGLYKKNKEDVIDGYALMTKEQKIYHKSFNDDAIAQAIVLNNGIAIFYTEDNVLYCIDIEGKQIFKKNVGISIDNSEHAMLSEHFCYFYGTNDNDEPILWIIDVATNKHWSKKFKHDWSESDRIIIENNTVSVVLPNDKKVLDMTGKILN